MTSLRALAVRLGIAALLVAGGLALIAPSQGQEGQAVPAPIADLTASTAEREVAVVAGGCFWGIQGVFQHVAGVTSAVSGYAGGEAATAQYYTVGTGKTGHAESVQITYDPKVITYGQILQIFFTAHDPTQLNRQGPDRGTQYRTAIFPQTAAQADVAKAYVAQLNQAQVFRGAIATTIEPGKTFYPAEDYHQDYLTLNTDDLYIETYDLPKLTDLQRLFPTRYRAEPALVHAKR